MKSNDGTELDEYNIHQLLLMRDDLMRKRLQKLKDMGQKQSEISKLQRDLIEMQKEAIALSEGFIAISEKLNERVGEARANN